MSSILILVVLLCPFASGVELSSRNTLYNLISTDSESTNKRFLEFFPDPQSLLSVMKRADPQEIDEVIAFVDGIIDNSNKEKAAILSCREEKQAFVDSAVATRTEETDEHTKIKAELLEARELVTEYEEKEEEKKTLEATRKIELDKAEKDVEDCQAEVDKVLKDCADQSKVYKQIKDLLKECENSASLEWTLGPKVDNDIYKKCSGTFNTFEDAQNACLADESCGWLHDFGCDDKKWRWCSTSVERTSGDGTACSYIKGSGSSKTAAIKAIVPPPLKDSFETKWGLDGWQGFSEVNSGYKIPYDGSISKWEYFAGSNSGVILQVWRLVSGNEYKLIGKNKIETSQKGKSMVIKVAKKDQIKVLKNDYIGWTFIGKAAFGFSSSQGTTRWSTGNGVAYKKIGKTFNFPGNGKRLYQIRATITASATLSGLIAINSTFPVNRTFI